MKWSLDPRRSTGKVFFVLLGIVVAGDAAAQDPTVDPATDWLSAVQKQIADSEYHVTWQEQVALAGVEGSWQAPNRAGGFRTYFLSDGIHVVPRTPEEAEWDLELSLVRIGRRGALETVSAPREVAAGGSRIDTDRGALVEWYVNDSDGLEQGFTLLERPGVVDAGALHLELKLSGSLVPRFSPDGQVVDFISATDGIVLHYSKLLVLDAAGTKLPARLEGFSRRGSGGIRIVVEDTYAVYPVVVDPLLTSASWTDEGTQFNEQFGFSVATAGDVNGDGYSDVAVGARWFDGGDTDEGVVFVYHGSASGLGFAPAWQHESDEALAELGYSVQTAGDVNADGYSDLIVGCPKCGPGGNASVFLGSGTGLVKPSNWTGVGGESGMEYGHSVAAAGDVDGDGYGDVLVGAPFADIMATDEGQAYLVYGSSSGIGADEDTLEGLPPLSFDHFGSAVAAAGDLNADGFGDIVIGVPGNDNGFVDAGAISIWLGDATGPLHFSTLDPVNAQVAHLGAAVGTAGDVNGDGYADVIAGAPLYDGGASQQGRVYVYMGEASGLNIGSPWIMDGGQADAHFGTSVGTAGDVNGDGYGDVIIGAPDWESEPLHLEEGAAFVFLGTGAGLHSAPEWTGEGNQATASYGYSVATAGDVNGDGFSDIVVGAISYFNGTDVGRAYAYLGSAAGLSPASSWGDTGSTSLEQHGFSVASAGDVNGDGYADVIVGIPRHDAGFVDNGSARVYHGGPTGLSTSFVWDTFGDGNDDHYGHSVAGAGDVNGDGYSDVIVGAPDFDNGPDFGVGLVRLYHGSSTGLSTLAAWTQIGTQGFANLGFSVASAGDIDGDGISDVIVGEPNYDHFSAADTGRAQVYVGSSTGLSTSASWSDFGDLNGRFGHSVASAGDVNGDGLSDVIVGEPGPCATCGTGEAFVYLGTKQGLAGTPVWSADGGTLSLDNRFGWSVGSAGDFNGDGFADIVVGNTLDVSLNHVNVYYGSSAGPSPTPDWQASGQSNTSDAGYCVGTAGDVNGDGFADLLAGEPGYDGAFTDEGRILYWLGSAGSGGGVGIPAEITGSEVSAQFGFSAASAGDVDGDGYADMIAGAPSAKTLNIDTGKSLLYSGNGAEGTSVELLPRQMRADGSGAVHHLGEGDDAASFELRLYARTPYGRGLVRMESEVKPLGALLDGTGVQTPTAFTATTALGTVILIEPQSGLMTGEEYHWRVRLDYDSVTLPFAPASRWMTMPWNGWQEMDLRTNDGAVLGAGTIPDDAASQLMLSRNAAGGLMLEWGDSCTPTDDDFAIYSGTIGEFASHVVETCSTGGVTSYSVSDGTCDVTGTPEQAPDPCRQYFLVVPLNTTDGREGSIGFDSRGLPRSPGLEICYPQEIASCDGTESEVLASK